MTSRPTGDDNLRNSLLKSRIAKLPHLPAIAPSQWSTSTSTLASEENQEQDGDGLGALSSAPPPRSASQRSAESRSLDLHYSPLSAEDCFQDALEVEIDEAMVEEDEQLRMAENNSQRASLYMSNGNVASKATFRVYYTPPIQLKTPHKRKVNPAPAVPHDNIPSFDSLVALEVDETDDSSDFESNDNPGTVFFFHHGAGYSALSYALVAKNITEATKGEAGVLAFDCRGHGKTRHSSTSESEKLSLDNLTADSMSILTKLFPPSKPQPTLILVGHSMGGAVVVSLCHALSEASKSKPVPRVAGVAVLDVVEGTAMSALSSMKAIISALPKGFQSVEEAIRWHVDSGTIVNAQSARRSVPSLLKKSDTTLLGIPTEQDDEVKEDAGEAVEELLSEPQSSSSSSSSIAPIQDGKGTHFTYRWRANLLATEPYWSEWFQGLSQSFLSVKCARLLLLAGTDRLDKDLMIGQMQGKYQLIVFSDVGHSLQEDAPQRTAQTLIDFWKRNESLDVLNIRGGLRKVGQA